MKRSGRKSAAQTPAPISERIKGSKRNPKGSAASSESANKINLSDNIIKVLKEKADAYNEKHPKSKVSVSTLKAIFRRGAGAYSSSHRPTITGGRPNSRTAWAYARVNKFLLKKGGTKVKAAYVQDDDLMERGAILGSSCKTYIANNESVLKTGYYLNLSDFSSMIDPYGQIPLNLNHTLVTYNSGNQDGLSLIDTINPINLQNELAEILNISINNAQVVVGLYIEMGEKLKSISQIESDNIIIIDRDKVVCKSNTNKLYHLGGDMSKHLAPNGKPSNLTHEQWHLVRTPAFKAWFGDWENDPENASKVIDENGEPLVVYRGGVQGSMNNTSGIWLSKSKQFAENYGKVSPYFVKVLKPIPNEVYDNTPVIMGGKFRYTISINNYISYDGYLGNFFRIVVKKYNQIKLADGSNTTFDSKNPDIRFEDGGLTDSLRMAMGNLKKNGIVLKDKNETITLIAYNTGNQERKPSLYNKSLIYKSVEPIKSANEIIQNFDLQDFEMFSEGKMEEYKKSHLIILNQNEVVYDSSVLAEGGLIAPNGKKSNLTPEQYDLVRTPAFKAWFGDWENYPDNSSKVVDENGEPLVVWHGTYIDNPFYIFDFEKADLGFHFGTYQQAKNRSKTKLFFKGHKSIVKPFFLNIKTIFETTDVGEWEYPQRYIDMLVSDNLITESDAKKNGFYRIFYKKDNKLVREYLIKKYTNSVGFNYENEYEGKGKSFIVLMPNQIKLADGSNTTFDGNNPDIRYEDGGELNSSVEELCNYAKNIFIDNLFEISHGSISRTDYGTSCYFYINYLEKSSENYGLGWKIRVSDHGVTNIYRTSSEHFIFKKDDIYKVLNEAEIYFKPNLFNKIEESKDFYEEKIVIVPKDNIVKLVEDNVYNPKTDEIIKDLGVSPKGNKKYLVNRLRTGKKTIYKKIDDANIQNIRYDDGGLIAPNGKKSNLTSEQYRLVRTPAFKAWFGDWENDPENASKVVDENGEPNVVYHGTNVEFYEFDLKYFGKTDKGWYGKGFYFTPNQNFTFAEDAVSEFGGKEVKLELFLDIKNPLYGQAYSEQQSNLVGSAKDRDKDGVVVLYDYGHEREGEVAEIIVWNNKKIKLADGSNTTFDAENPDIRYAEGGETFSDEEGLYLIIKDVKQENRYKGAYKKIFDIIEDSVSLYNPYGTDYEEIKGSDLHIYITPRPDGHIIEEIKRLKNVEISDSDLSKYHLGGDMSKHLAPNGKPSNLTHEQWHLVRTPAFKAWFGDWENDPQNASKVVDDNGEPLVLHRGNLVTQEELGYTFNLGQNFLKKKNGNEFGFFFSNEIDTAKKYMLVDHFDEIRGGSLTSVFIQSNKILDLLDFNLKIGQDNFVQGLIEKGVIFTEEYNYLEKKILDFNPDDYKYWGYNVFDYFDVFPELRNLFIKNGFNSVIFYEMSRRHSKYRVYVAFNSNQIKLADGSNTTFDSKNPDIRYEDGGEMQQNIALPDTYSTFDKLKPILANQGYELNKIGDNNFAEGGLLKPTMSVAQIAKKHGKKESYIEKQLEIGTKHELEHSYSEELAKKTALHHLADMADYYTRLKKMELQQEAEKLTNYYADGGVTDYGTCEVLDEDGERMIDEKSIKQLTECVMNLPQTKSFHIDFETSQYKPYRRRLHKDIIYQIKKDLICVEREEPIAILLGGSPASGKSTFLKRYAPYLLSDEILKIDADEIRAKLPEYRGYNAAQTHLETKDIVTTLLSDRNIGIPCTFDVIYDGTMNNTKSYAPLIQLLKSLGYKVFIIYIDKVPKDVAINRALKRYQNSGRFVPVEVIEDFFTKGKTALNELKSSVDGYMIVDGSDKNYHVIERGGIKIPQDRSYSNIGSPIQITTEDVVREFAKGGQVGMQGSIKHSSGAAGGYLVGKRHSEGGIKAINKSTNQPLEMEGGEVVITRNAVSDSEKREFEGEMLTNREILSRINQSGGGVSFEKGGQTDYKCACNGKKYAYGGKVLSDYEIVNQINGLYPSSGIMTFSEYKDQFNKEASTKDYFNHLQKTGVDTSSITFTERAKLLTY